MSQKSTCVPNTSNSSLEPSHLNVTNQLAVTKATSM